MIGIYMGRRRFLYSVRIDGVRNGWQFQGFSDSALVYSHA